MNIKSSPNTGRAHPFGGAKIRKDVLDWIIQVFSRGDCCALVGPSNTGKSLLLRSLLEKASEIQSPTSQGKPPLLVFIDCLDCAGESELAFYELLLRRIHLSMEQNNYQSNDITEVITQREELLNAKNPVEIRAHFAISMHSIGCIPGINLVLLLDEFDDVFRSLSPWPFRQLRAIRDTLGTRLSYLTATSHYLKDLRNDAETYEFRELFQMYQKILKPLGLSDRHTLLDHLIKTNRLTIPEEQQTHILALSGGHPGFLTRIALCMHRDSMTTELIINTNHQSPEVTRQEISRRLLQHEPIREECRRLWSELEPQEQFGLMNLINDQSTGIEPEQLKRLMDKGILTFQDDSTPRIFSPLFQAFLMKEAAYYKHRSPRGIICNQSSGQIWVDGKEITLLLSDLQRKLLRFLHSENGSTCTHQAIISEVWGAGEGVTPGALYELVKRLRKKIEPDWQNPSYLLTVPGEGYRLDQPN